MGDYKVSYINGAVSFPEENQTMPVLEETTSKQTQAHKSVFLGDVKLAEFREVLRKEGFKAELFGGVLLTLDGNLALKKELVNGVSTIRMEGLICLDYFRIRELLYQQFCIL